MGKENPFMSKKNEFIECLDGDDFEEEGMIDGGYDEKIHGKAVASFNFSESKFPTNEPLILTEEANKAPFGINTPLLDNRYGKPCANGITPPVDGEFFDVNRTYKLRRSTAKMLNELKASHSNVNVYMNTIVDTAIRHYYNHIFFENGVQ